MDDKKQKKLRNMATWSVTVFATVFAVVMAVLWIPLFNAGNSAFAAVGQAFSAGWVPILLALVLCVGTYAGYTIYLGQKK
jgi:hypothetical protein